MIDPSCKNIIFDLGGLFIQIDYQKTITAFQQLGLQDFEIFYSKKGQSELFDRLETGQLTEAAFLVEIRKHLPQQHDDVILIAAWNAMLLHWDEENLNVLKTLKNRYRLFLFSNTNALHQKAFLRLLQYQVGFTHLDNFFEKTYYSHEFGFRKPHPESFTRILEENGLEASETVFFDDSIQHIEGAEKAGLTAIHVQMNTSLLPYFERK